MLWKNISYLCLATSSIFVISGCGSSSDETSITLPKVNQAKGFDGPLAQGQAATFVRNGIYATTLTGNPTATPADSTAVPSTAENFSQTNTIEQGVDEADRVKYDGNTLFLATYPVWSETGTSDPKVRVLTRNDDFSLSEQSPITYDVDDINIHGLYLNDAHLAVVGSAYPVYSVDALSLVPWYYDSANLTIDIFDVSNPSDIAQTTNIKIDGALLSTRLIEDELYVISSYVPYIENLTPGAITDQQKIDNYRRILNTSSTDIMPKMYKDGQAQAMNDLNQCYVPQAATIDDGHAQILTVTRINLQQPTDTASTCLSVYAFMMYMSQNSLYLASNTDNDKTAFHKIDLVNLTYQASGSVDGSIGWQSDPLFKVDEEQDFLRVVTTDYSGSSPLHKLHILQQQGADLANVATLPNDSQPDAIGKPGEEIYAVRFIEDKAYIVTFEQVDPLYVIDLSDNTQPVIQGSLEIPGFSRYLQPLKNDLVLGVGQQVDPQDIPVAGDQITEPVDSSGMKISLFDVKDPANPLELSKIIKSETYTPVEFNYKALTWLETDGNYQFAFPTETWFEVPSSNSSSYWQAQTALLLLETDSNSDVPSLDEVGTIKVDASSQEYVYVGDDRTIIHGDKIYYIHGNKVWLSDWQTPDITFGPY